MAPSLDKNTAFRHRGTEASGSCTKAGAIPLPNSHPWERDCLWTTSCQSQTSDKLQVKQVHLLPVSLCLLHQNWHSPYLEKHTANHDFRKAAQNTARELAHSLSHNSSEQRAGFRLPNQAFLIPNTKFCKLLLAGNGISCLNRNVWNHGHGMGTDTRREPRTRHRQTRVWNYGHSMAHTCMEPRTQAEHRHMYAHASAVKIIKNIFLWMVSKFKCQIFSTCSSKNY